MQLIITYSILMVYGWCNIICLKINQLQYIGIVIIWYIQFIYIHLGLLTGDPGDFSPRLQKLHSKVKEFIYGKVIPLERKVMEYHDDPDTKWTVCSKIEELKVCTYVCSYEIDNLLMHAHAHAHILKCTHTRSLTHATIHMHTHRHTHMHTHTCTHAAHTYTHTYAHTHSHTCTHACTHIHSYAHTHAHKHTRTSIFQLLYSPLLYSLKLIGMNCGIYSFLWKQIQKVATVAA